MEKITQNGIHRRGSCHNAHDINGRIGFCPMLFYSLRHIAVFPIQKNDGVRSEIIRKAQYEDTLQLERLFQFTRQKTFASRPLGEFQIGDYQQSTNDDKVWVFEKDGFIVGFVSVYLPDNFIHNLCVHPDHQRQGIGRRLLHIAESHLTCPMTLKIAMDNLKVSEFYKKQGWYQVSIHDDKKEPYTLYGKDT